METIPKPKRIVDEELLERVRNQICLICGTWPCDPTHVRSRGAGGHDVDFNVAPLCRFHHIHQHRFGVFQFLKKYPEFRAWLEDHGWEINEERADLHHPRIVNPFNR